MVKDKIMILESVNFYISELEKLVPINKVILFGSWAQGNPTEYSDIDLAIFSPSFGKSRLKELQLLSKLSWQVDASIEAIPYSSDKLKDPEHTSFIHEILNTGEIIYDGTFKH